MARPAKISLVLEHLKKEKQTINGNDPNKVKKPKLLSKKERLNIANNLLTNKASDSTDNIDYETFINVQHKKSSNLNQLENVSTQDLNGQDTVFRGDSSSSLYTGSRTGNKSKSRSNSKFQFTWDLNDD